MRRPPPTSFPTLFSGNSVWTRRLRNPKTEKIPLFRVNRGIFSCVGETGFEPATSNSRSWRANRTALHPERKRCFLSVGVTGFEPVTPCSQSRCANRTALHPELVSAGRFSRDTSLRFAVRAPEGNSPIPECKDNGFFPKSQFLARKWPALRCEGRPAGPYCHAPEAASSSTCPKSSPGAGM